MIKKVGLSVIAACGIASADTGICQCNLQHQMQVENENKDLKVALQKIKETQGFSSEVFTEEQQRRLHILLNSADKIDMVHSSDTEIIK